jgi:carbamate kinase
VSHSTEQRVLVALGGNALTPGGDAAPDAQQAAVEVAMEQVAELVASEYEVGLTHGNGPQVGNLLTKNELARSVVPAVPLDWCVAQTQATIGYLIVTALDRALRAGSSARWSRS